MKTKKFILIFIIGYLILSVQVHAISISIKLVFEGDSDPNYTGFYYNFKPGRVWGHLDDDVEDIKSLIENRMSTDYSSYSITVSTSSGNLVVYIGRSGSGFGLAVSGLGSYVDGSAYAEVYSNNFGNYSEWQGSNATISRIVEAIAGTASHEAGHLINLYHAYMFDSFDPTIDGALKSNYQPKEPEYLPSSCKTDPYQYKHLMATRSYITLEQRATIDRFFSQNSDFILKFAKNGGYDVNRNITWGIDNKTWKQERNITVLSEKTIFFGANNFTIKVEYNKQIIVNGTIITANENTFTTDYSQWYGIRFNSTASNSSYVKDCTIENATNGVYIDGSDPTIDDCDISNCSVRAVYVKGSGAQPTIKFCNMHDNDWGAILIEDDADPKVFENKIYTSYGTAAYIYSADGLFCGNEFRTSSTNYGIVVYGSTSSPEFNEDYYQGNRWDMNHIGGSRAVNIPSGRPEFGDYPIHRGANDFLNLGANEYYIYNNTGNTILAEKNYWGDVDPEDDYWYHGSVDKDPYEDDPQNAGPSWKINASSYQDALIAYDEGDYEKALRLFESLLKTEPEHERIAKISFLYAKSALKAGCLDKKLSVLEGFTKDNYNEEVGHVNRVWQAYYYASIGDMDASKAVSLSAPKGSNSERELMLSLIGYYISNDDSEGAEAIASLLSENRKDDPTIEEDIEMMLNCPKLSFNDEPQPKFAGEETETTEVDLNAYPNPFNTSTFITIRINNPGRVDLKVFNMLGQEVRTLIDEWRDAGEYKVHWDGNDNFGSISSSGIYFIQYKTEEFSKTLKLVFMK